MLIKTIFICDDHAVMQDELAAIISTIPEYKIIGTARNGDAALSALEKRKPDILILDLSLPTISGVKVCYIVKKIYSNIKIIILTRHDNSFYIRQLLDFGADAYVLKDDVSDELLKAIRHNDNTKPYISTKLLEKQYNYEIENQIQDYKYEITTTKYLTKQQSVVLKLISEGKTTKRIAAELFISPETVKKHRTNIMNRLNLHKSSDLVIYAIKSGIKKI